MKSCLITLLFIHLTASGQEVECPKAHAGAALTTASGMFGGRGEEWAEFHGGSEKSVRDGVNVDMPTDTRWLVCWYGKGRSTSMWLPLKHDPDKVRNCTMKIRGTKAPNIAMVCK